MSFARTARALAGNDARSIGRESFLVWMAFYPIGIALLTRFGAPWLAGKLEAHVDLTLYYGPIVSFMCVLTPAGLIGFVYGFVLIDDRDEGTLQALLVTPMPISMYTLFRIALPILFSVIAVMVCVPIAGIAPVPWYKLLPIAFAASWWAPISAMFLVTFAENKVQGLALFKIVNVFSLAPVAALFIPEPWQHLVGVVPLYWSAYAFWQLADGSPWYGLSVTIAIITQGVVLLWLLRRFNRVVHR